MNNFADEEGAQQAMRILEEHTVLNALREANCWSACRRRLASKAMCKWLIAGDGRYENLSRTSMVPKPLWRSGENERGRSAYWGPTHINYGRAISTVRYVSNLMTNMLATLYQDGARRWWTAQYINFVRLL